MDAKPDKKLGLCLAGGGGLGFLHIGLFEAMEELGLKPGVVAGTSAGAVLGALYASGKTSAEMRAILKGFKWVQMVSPAIPFRGFISTARMQAFYRKHLGRADLSELPIKLKVAAVDLHSGELANFTSGPIARCLAASCAVPGIFEPVVIQRHAYYDAGGIFNLPLESLSGEGVDTIIAGNTIGEYGLMKSPRTVQDTIMQAYLIRTKHLTAWRTGSEGWTGKTGEWLVMVDYHSKGISPMSLEDCQTLIEKTREQALAILRMAFRI